MSYIDRFLPADDLIKDLLKNISLSSNIRTSGIYAGFLSVSSITVFELAIKDIFIDFATKKNSVFGHFVDTTFSGINGKIQLDELKNKQIKAFGIKYLQKFDLVINEKENLYLVLHKKSLKAAYGNLISCRHQFVHQGNATLTLLEVIENYTLGKEIIHTLYEVMKR